MKCDCPLSAGLCLELVSLRSAAAFVLISLINLVCCGLAAVFHPWHLLSPLSAICGWFLTPQVPAVLQLQHREHLKN